MGSFPSSFHQEAHSTDEESSTGPADESAYIVLDPDSMSSRNNIHAAEERVKMLGAITRSAPILRLPPEIILMIFKYLQPTEAANARLFNKEFATVGVEFLVSEVFLVSTRESFERLRAISEHPVVRYKVLTICYDGSLLPMLDRGAWEGQVLSPERQSDWQTFQRSYPDRHPDSDDSEDDSDGSEDGSNISDEDANELAAKQQALSRLNALPRYHYNVDQLNDAFLLYCKLIREQGQIAISKACAERVAEAMGRFPRLVGIEIDIGHADVASSPHRDEVVKCYAATFCRPIGGGGLSMFWGKVLWDSILSGLYCHRRDLGYLTLRRVSWRFFRQNEQVLQALKQAMAGLYELEIGIEAIGKGAQLEDDVNEGIAFVKTGGLALLITSAPKLETLAVKFGPGWDNPWTMPMEKIFEDRHWQVLESVELEGMIMTEDYLVAFFKRHAAKLRVLQLFHMRLSEGSWFSTFRSMREILQLNQVRLRGFLVDDRIGWNFHSRRTADMVGDVQDYLLGKGPGIMDEEEFLNRRGVRRYNS